MLASAMHALGPPEEVCPLSFDVVRPPRLPLASPTQYSSRRCYPGLASLASRCVIRFLRLRPATDSELTHLCSFAGSTQAAGHWGCS